MTTARTGSTPTPFGFAGAGQYQTDPDTGLMLLGHRYYDASTGRFLSQDPAKDGSNWYDYCNNNPLKQTDPKGLCVAVLGLGLAIPGVGEVIAVVAIAVVVVVAIDAAENSGWVRGAPEGEPPSWDKPERPLEKDVKLDPDGNVLPGSGPSITNQPGNLPPAIPVPHPVGPLPPELEINPKPTRRDPGHAEIGPRKPMPLPEFKDLLPKFPE